MPNSNGSSYIVLESVNLRRQLYNMDLKNPKILIESGGKTILLESFRMTAGKGKKKESEVKNAFKNLGISTNQISIVLDSTPDWLKTLTDILNWGILRENVKLSFKNKVILESQMSKETKSITEKKIYPLNQILYGPPGTGKTHKLKNEFFSKYTLTENSISPEANFEDVVASLTWWQVIALALIEIGTNKVNEILENRWVAKKRNFLSLKM